MGNKKYKLYHKISPLGLNYLGMTTKENIFTYKGSGKYWKLHLKKHNVKIEEIKTILLFETDNQEELKEKGVFYSKLYNVVESDEWANLIFETGEGISGNKLSEEHKKKISLATMGRQLSKESIQKIVDKNTGRKNSDESKAKMSKAAIKRGGIKHTEETKLKISKNKTGKPKVGVGVIDLETGIFWSSIREVAKIYNLNENILEYELRKNNDSFRFRFSDENHLNKAKITRKKGVVSEEGRKNMSLFNGMSIKIIHIESGKEFNSIREGAEFIGVKSDTLNAQLKNNRKCEFKYKNK